MQTDLHLQDMAAFFILSYYLIKDFYLPEDELASLSFSYLFCDRKLGVTGLRIRPVQLNLNV